MVYQARAYLGFLSMKQLVSIVAPPEGMQVCQIALTGSPVQIYTLGGERKSKSKVSCTRTQQSDPDQGLKLYRLLDPESTAPTIKPAPTLQLKINSFKVL